MSGAASDARFIGETGVAAQIAAMAEPVLADLGFRLVRVVLSGRNGTTVQIMAERPDGTITVEGVRSRSRAVCRPCSTRTIRSRATIIWRCPRPASTGRSSRPSDFEEWAGHEAKIELKELLAGRKRFRGMLEGVEGDEVRIEVEPRRAGPPSGRACRSGWSPRRGWC